MKANRLPGDEPEPPMSLAELLGQMLGASNEPHEVVVDELSREVWNSLVPVMHEIVNSTTAENVHSMVLEVSKRVQKRTDKVAGDAGHGSASLVAVLVYLNCVERFASTVMEAAVDAAKCTNPTCEVHAQQAFKPTPFVPKSDVDNPSHTD